MRKEYEDEIGTVIERLSYKGSELEDHATLAAYGIGHGAKLISRIRIVVRDRQCQLEQAQLMYDFSTIFDLKVAFGNSTARNAVPGKCSYRGRELADSDTIYQCELGPNSVHVPQLVPVSEDVTVLLRYLGCRLRSLAVPDLCCYCECDR